MLGIFLLIAGIINLYFAIRFLRDPQFAENYIRKSPKAFIWRKMFGEEKAIKLTQRFFAPLGILLGAGMVIAGIYFAIIK